MNAILRYGMPGKLNDAHHGILFARIDARTLGEAGWSFGKTAHLVYVGQGFAIVLFRSVHHAGTVKAVPLGAIEVILLPYQEEPFVVAVGRGRSEGLFAQIIV